MFAMTNGLNGSDATSIPRRRAVQSGRRDHVWRAPTLGRSCFFRRTRLTQRLDCDAATLAGVKPGCLRCPELHDRDMAGGRRGTFGFAGVMAAMIFAAAPAWSQSATAPNKGRGLESVLAEKLSVVEGKILTAQIVHYPPSGSSKSHHHDADVFAFVLSGKIRSQTEGSGEARVYSVGEGRFERRGQHHLISENASATEPASMLVVYIGNEGATLTTFDR